MQLCGTWILLLSALTMDAPHCSKWNGLPLFRMSHPGKAEGLPVSGGGETLSSLLTLHREQLQQKGEALVSASASGAHQVGTWCTGPA